MPTKLSGVSDRQLYANSLVSCSKLERGFRIEPIEERKLRADHNTFLCAQSH